MKRYVNQQRTRRLRATAWLVAVPCILGWFDKTHAQDADRVTIDAGRCRKIESPAERLACFEAQVDAAGTGEHGKADQPAPKRAPKSAPKSADVTPPRAAQPSIPTVDVARLPREDERVDEPSRQSESAGYITALKLRAPNQYVVTLDSGQVWQQRLARRYALRVGQHVRVYSTKWGVGYRLEADGVNGFIQVDLAR